MSFKGELVLLIIVIVFSVLVFIYEVYKEGKDKVLFDLCLLLGALSCFIYGVNKLWEILLK